jgi:hypothetical protein
VRRNASIHHGQILTRSTVALRGELDSNISWAATEGNAILGSHVWIALWVRSQSATIRCFRVAAERLVLSISCPRHWWAVGVIRAACSYISFWAVSASVRAFVKLDRRSYHVLSAGTTTTFSPVGVMQPGSFSIIPWTGSHGKIALVSGQKVEKLGLSEARNGGQSWTPLECL